MATNFADVVIIGGGPAGAICGLRLKQDPRGTDRRVVVIERDPFPRYKVCGCCFNGAGQGVLKEAGCGSLIEDLGGVPLDRWEAMFAGRRVRAALPTGWALSRDAMDQELLRRAEAAGVELLQPATGKVLSTPHSASPKGSIADRFVVKVSHRDGREQNLETPLVVLAGGLAGSAAEDWLPWQQRPSGPVGAGASFISQSDDYQPGTIYMACAKQGYAGIVRVEDGRLDVAAAIYDPRGQSRSVPLGERVAEIIAAAGMPAIPELCESNGLANGAQGTHWKGTPLLHRQRVVGRGGMLAIGDAAGYVEPFTGEGMAWALRTAQLAAESIVGVAWDRQANGAHKDTTAGHHYSLAYRRILTGRRLPCRMVIKALRHDFSRSLLFSTLATAPWLARPFIGRINRA